MKTITFIVSTVLLLLFSASLAVARPAQESRVTITGTLRLVGNEPFTRFALRTEEGKSYILEDVPREEWSQVLGKKITVKGTLEIRNLESADKTKTFTEYIILDAVLQS